jgi:hypothetical protein
MVGGVVSEGAEGRHFSLDEVYRTTGQQELVPTWTATRILWLRKHEPEVFRKAQKYLLVEDILIYRLAAPVPPVFACVSRSLKAPPALAILWRLRV